MPSQRKYQNDSSNVLLVVEGGHGERFHNLQPPVRKAGPKTI
jgi:hypothetical protein